MPITLGCPSCGKRFRARDESAGKRVKCPFCQAPVSVSVADEGADAGAAADVLPGPNGGGAAGWGLTPAAPPPRPPASGEVERPLFDIVGKPPQSAPPAAPRAGFLPPPAAPVAAASPGAWGADDPPAPAQGYRLGSEPLPPAANPFAGAKTGAAPAGGKVAAKGGKGAPGKAPKDPTPAAWRKTKAGLFWALFALFWAALLGAVPFGKLAYERGVGPLPTGDGWVVIDGKDAILHVNADVPNAILTTKTEELNALLYGVPVLLGGLALAFGRLTCGAAPRSSGGKGLFVLSGLFTLLAVCGLLTLPVCQRTGFVELAVYAQAAAVYGLGLAEVWFVVGLAAIGATLRRPKAVRAAGFHAVVLGLGLVLVMTGWGVYQQYAAEIWQQTPKEDRAFVEEAAKMLGWLIVVGTAWRAVGGGRAAIRDYLQTPGSLPA